MLDYITQDVYCGICGFKHYIEKGEDTDYILPANERHFSSAAEENDEDYDPIDGSPILVTHRRFTTVCSGCQNAIAMIIDLRRSCRSTANAEQRKSRLAMDARIQHEGQ